MPSRSGSAVRLGSPEMRYCQTPGTSFQTFDESLTMYGRMELSGRSEENELPSLIYKSPQRQRKIACSLEACTSTYWRAVHFPAWQGGGDRRLCFDSLIRDTHEPTIITARPAAAGMAPNSQPHRAEKKCPRKPKPVHKSRNVSNSIRVILESLSERLRKSDGGLAALCYFAAPISSTIACAAARGSGAARIGLPTTRKSAPARIASVGVALRA